MFPGYVSGGNFGTPLILTFSHSFLPTSLTWSYDTSYGAPVVSPWIYLLDRSYMSLLFLFGGMWSPGDSMKLFVLFSTALFALAFYWFSFYFSHRIIPRVLATLFLLLNPVSVQYIMQGLVTSFFWYGCYLISLVLLARGTTTHDTTRTVKLLASACFLAISIGDPSTFYVGVPLYFLFLIYFSFVDSRVTESPAIRSFLKTLGLTFSFFLLFLAPVIATSIHSAYNITPASSMAHPLSGYILYSESLWNMLTLNADPALPLYSIVASPYVSEIWYLSIEIVSLAVLESGIIFRDRRLLYFDAIAIVACLFGAGYYSPIASLNVYLYENLPGYQFLNDAYMWEWAIVAPLYSVMLTIVIDKLILATRSEVATENNESTRTNEVLRSNSKTRIIRIITAFLISVLLIVIGVPLEEQVYYGNDGIHSTVLPTDYLTLEKQLKNLIGDSNLGVAFFPPDIGLVFGNSSGGSIDPLLLNPYYRIAEPQQYTSVPAPSDYYFYWVYNEFYSNQTTNIAQLMGLMGVKYFVTLNNVDHNGRLSTLLMNYQKNLTCLYSSSNYSIYESILPIGLGGSFENLTLLTGGYQSLLNAASMGVNISGLALIFQSDMNSTNFNFVMKKASGIVFSDGVDFQSFAITKFLNDTDVVYPTKFVSHYSYSIDREWVQNSVLYTWPQTIPYSSIASVPYAFTLTQSHEKLEMPYSTHTGGNYTIWALVFNSPVSGSTLTFSVDNQSYTQSTVYSGYHGAFKWIRIPLVVGGPGELVVNQSGFNGIAEIALIKKGAVSNETAYLQSYVNKSNIEIVALNGSMSSQAIHSIHQINNSSKTRGILRITNNPNYYTINGIASNDNLIRFNYFNSVRPTVSGVSEIPVLGGINYIMITTGNITEISFTSVEYSPFVAGGTIFIATFIGGISYTCIRRIRKVK